MFQESIATKFFDRLVEWAKNIKVSDPLEEGCRLGPIVSEGQVCLVFLTSVFTRYLLNLPPSFYFSTKKKKVTALGKKENIKPILHLNFFLGVIFPLYFYYSVYSIAPTWLVKFLIISNTLSSISIYTTLENKNFQLVFEIDAGEV